MNQQTSPLQIRVFPWETEFAQKHILPSRFVTISNLPYKGTHRIFIPENIFALLEQKDRPMHEQFIVVSQDRYEASKIASELDVFYAEIRDFILQRLKTVAFRIMVERRQVFCNVFCPEEVAYDMMHCFEWHIDKVGVRLYVARPEDLASVPARIHLAHCQNGSYHIIPEKVHEVALLCFS